MYSKEETWKKKRHKRSFHTWPHFKRKLEFFGVFREYTKMLAQQSYARHDDTPKIKTLKEVYVPGLQFNKTCDLSRQESFAQSR